MEVIIRDKEMYERFLISEPLSEIPIPAYV